KDDRRTRPFVGELLEKLVRGVRLLERNRVPQLFRAGEYLEQTAVVLGEVVAEELVIDQTSALEMKIVKDRVFNAGFRESRDEILLPNACGHPHSAHFGAEDFAKVFGIVTNLADAIPMGNHRHDRFVESAAEDFDAPRYHECPDARDILRSALNKPFEQRP